MAALSAETVRPLCDTVRVESAQIVDYGINAVLTTYPGTGQAQVLAAAQASVAAYVAKMRKLELDIPRSGIVAALYVAGVQDVVLASPADNVLIQWNQAANCTGIALSVGGTNE